MNAGIEPLLSELAARLGVNELNLDDNNICRLVFDERLVVDLEPSTDGKLVHLTGVAGAVPADATAHFFRKLLVANFLGQQTGEAALAVDEFNNEVVLGQRIALDVLDVNSFVNRLEEFVNRLESWMDALAKDAVASEVETSSPPGANGGIRV